MDKVITASPSLKQDFAQCSKLLFVCTTARTPQVLLPDEQCLYGLDALSIAQPVRKNFGNIWVCVRKQGNQFIDSTFDMLKVKDE